MFKELLEMPLRCRVPPKLLDPLLPLLGVLGDTSVFVVTVSAVSQERLGLPGVQTTSAQYTAGPDLVSKGVRSGS